MVHADVAMAPATEIAMDWRAGTAFQQFLHRQCSQRPGIDDQGRPPFEAG
jgi:hypothetical protein